MPALPTSEMAQTFGPKDLVTLEELTISNMWEVAALIVYTASERELH